MTAIPETNAGHLYRATYECGDNLTAVSLTKKPVKSYSETSNFLKSRMSIAVCDCKSHTSTYASDDHASPLNEPNEPTFPFGGQQTYLKIWTNGLTKKMAMQHVRQNKFSTVQKSHVEVMFVRRLFTFNDFTGPPTKR